MRTYKRHTVNVPPALNEALEARMKELKYRSSSAYFISLLVFDLHARKPHLLTGTLQNERPEMQDKFYEEIARDYATGEPGPAGWFEIRLKELLAEERAKLPGM